MTPAARLAGIREAVTQTRLHDPENGVRGNCVAACLASVTGAPIETFDHIIESPDWWGEFEKSCMEHGYYPLNMSPGIADGTPSGVHFGSGTSPRGVRHMVVCCDGEIVHDPHPSRAGLLEVDTWTVLVPWKAYTLDEAQMERIRIGTMARLEAAGLVAPATPEGSRG